MANIDRPPRIRGISDVAGQYRYLLCDAWGVLHNGLRAYPQAVRALISAREAGLRVFVLTNAPRPKSEVMKQFERFGVDHSAFDDIVTSGEAARAYLAALPGARAFYLGPDRDRAVFEGLGIDLVGEGEAEIIACTGPLDDERETVEDYAERMADWVARGLILVCANPDKWVERGNRLVWCAGLLAERYANLGGKTVVLGKPHRPIYETALKRFADLAAGPVDPAQVLAIGDAAETDLRGANEAGLDVLFVTAGIHAERFGAREDPDEAAVADFLTGHGLRARAFIPHLVW
ncbi:MAG TPA: TIGR01459 family HAD-type hydrolase [Bauldia sp.]|nr:TIGR01459 family HAD-type hydrolase [Bauldia sp.]